MRGLIILSVITLMVIGYNKKEYLKQKFADISGKIEKWNVKIVDSTQIQQATVPISFNSKNVHIKKELKVKTTVRESTSIKQSTKKKYLKTTVQKKWIAKAGTLDNNDAFEIKQNITEMLYKNKNELKLPKSNLGDFKSLSKNNKGIGDFQTLSKWNSK